MIGFLRSGGNCEVLFCEKNRKFSAFTLAEVLITLGVIGIVAALTLPGVITKYQEKRVATQLKVAVSTLEQGFKKMLADEGVDSLVDTPFFQHYVEGSNYPYEIPESVAVLKKYFPGVKVYSTQEEINQLGDAKYKDNRFISTSPWRWTVYEFPKGFSTNFGAFAPKGKESPVGCDAVKAAGGAYCRLMVNEWLNFPIDVNGNEPPNRNGYDRFYFVLTDDGRIFPSFDANYSIYSTGRPDSAYYIYDNPSFRCPTTAAIAAGASGFFDNYSGCAAKIIADGWEIKYYWKGAND